MFFRRGNHRSFVVSGSRLFQLLKWHKWSNSSVANKKQTLARFTSSTGLSCKLIALGKFIASLCKEVILKTLLFSTLWLEAEKSDTVDEAVESLLTLKGQKERVKCQKWHKRNLEPLGMECWWWCSSRLLSWGICLHRCVYCEAVGSADNWEKREREREVNWYWYIYICVSFPGRAMLCNKIINVIHFTRCILWHAQPNQKYMLRHTEKTIQNLTEKNDRVNNINLLSELHPEAVDVSWTSWKTQTSCGHALFRGTRWIYIIFGFCGWS